MVSRNEIFIKVWSFRETVTSIFLYVFPTSSTHKKLVPKDFNLILVSMNPPDFQILDKPAKADLALVKDQQSDIHFGDAIGRKNPTEICVWLNVFCPLIQIGKTR